jgi:Beta-lactamase class C and other penicillin binding proteins
MSDRTTQHTPEAEETAPKRGRRPLAIGITAALVAVAAANGVWQAVSATTPDPGPGAVIERELHGLVDLGFPGALASWTDADGRHGDYVAGVGDLTTGDPVPVDGEVRVGSNTKTYTAVVVLQLVEEGLVALDEPIETYLPGLVRGEGIDGAAVTVRQLLQHTSGLPEYTTDRALEIERLQHSYAPPRDLLDRAFTHPAVFAPGERWSYSNTNYLLLGMLVERLVERPLFEVVTDRIIEPLGLEHTYFPTVGEQELRGEHPHAYHVDAAGDPLDVTVLDPSFGWAAGAVVATPSDLNEFFRAIFDGRLLGDEMLAEMTTTVPSEDPLWTDAQYGLGIQSYRLSDGTTVWGHGGDIHGFQTRNAVTEEGVAFTVAVTSLPWAFIDPADEEPLLAAYRAVVASVDAALTAER